MKLAMLRKANKKLVERKDEVLQLITSLNDAQLPSVAESVAVLRSLEAQVLSEEWRLPSEEW
eukprot:7315227-Prymnesium_polylepis.1